MDIFNSVYYNINKNLHRCLGCWPYQRRHEKYMLRFFVLLLNISIIIPQTINLIYIHNDLSLLVDCLPVFLSQLIHIAKYLTYIINADKMLKILNMMQRNWQMAKTNEERFIMRQYAAVGRTISVAMLITYYTCTACYLAVPIIPKVLDVWYPLNETRPIIKVFETEYFVDPVKYYIPIYIHHCIFAVLGVMSIIATDTTYGIYAHHACGMFAVVRDQLDNMPFSKKYIDNLISNETQNFKKIVACIEKHKRAIWFSDMIEAAHTVSMFIIMLISVYSLTMTGLQTVSHLNNPSQAFRFALFCIGHFFHVYFYTWNSQNILDHSSRIYDAAYNAKWYATLDKTSMLLIMVMIRSSKPCIQTAGKMFPMTLMTFTGIVKTSMSYFTVLSNFQ